MLSFFRSFFKTRIGLALVLAFLALMGFAFASMDVSNTATFGGIAGGDRVAVVGDEKIGTADLARAATDELDRQRQQNPTLTMAGLLARGGLEQALNDLINRSALVEWAREHGFRAGENLVNSEIRQIPAAAGPSGAFDENTYRAFLAREQLSDARLRELIGAGLVAQQTIVPVSYGATIPASIARTYARVFKERRTGEIALLSADAFAPSSAPSAAQLQTYYDDSRARFVRPERRVIQYAQFDAASLGDAVEPTQAEIAAAYRQNAAQYAASEERSFTQLIVPTQDAARSIAQRVSGGQSLAAAAQAGGLRTTQIDDASREEIRGQASEAVANAYFAAAKGSVTSPARSPLGWHIAQVRSVDRIAARPLEQVRGELATRIRQEKRTRLLSDLALKLEDQITEGANLQEIASGRRAQVSTTAPLLATGQIYGQQESAPALLQPVLNVAFQMEEGEPEISALPGGETYLVYQVTEITPAATAPLAEIRDEVTAQWRQAMGARRARDVANRLVKRVEGGSSVTQAIAAEQARAAVEQVSLSREELARLGGQRVPPSIALLFGMAQGSVKTLEVPGNRGWYVVNLENVTLDDLAPNDPLIAQAQAELGQIWGAEYGEQLGAAMRKEVGVERNADAIQAVRRQLLGEN